MAARKPVVSSRVGRVAGVVKDGRTLEQYKALSEAVLSGREN
jgi:hypothetical protein